MRRSKIAAAVILLAFVASAAASAQTAAAPRRTIWDGVYANAQADRGLLTIGGKCAACHTAAEWTAKVFLDRWAGRSILVLFDTIRLTMPSDAPGELTREQYAEIVACILKLNGAAAGTAVLPSDADGLKLIDVTPKPAR